MKFLLSVFIFLLSINALADHILISHRVDSPFFLDGRGDEYFWKDAVPVIIHEKTANIDVSVKSVHTEDMVIFLVQFPDPTENREHRNLVWNKKTEMYEEGSKIEDVFLFKWRMSPEESDLRLDSDTPYVADVWFWKAYRTDHAGFADDKYHKLTAVKEKNSKMQISQSGKIYYFSRYEDSGQAAYKTYMHYDFDKDEMPYYSQVKPSGSRADVHAKGFWKNGLWTVEFSRKLNTGQSDDLIMEIGKEYDFAVSRYEIAGRKPDKSLNEPFYGAGEVSEIYKLKLMK